MGMDGAIVVGQRRVARRLNALRLCCDAKEIPEFLTGGKPVGWWLAGQATFAGPAQPLAEDRAPTEAVATKAQGTAALVVGGGRIGGIVSPNAVGEPAVWFAASVGSLQIQQSGSQGLLRQRPTTIYLSAGGWSVTLSAVGRLYRHSGQYKTGQEGSLLKALQLGGAY